MADTPGRITLWGVEVFVAVAEEGSVSAAARRLGASASSVSQQITNLETALGSQLMHRSARPLTLTPAGEMFRPRAQTILNEAALARAELAADDLAALTRFRMGVIEDFEADVTPRLLSRLAVSLEGCQFLLETGASHVLHDQLEARALDAIVAAEMGPPADGMEVHPILTEGFVGAAPRGRIDLNRDLLAQLSPLPLVQYSARHFMGRLIAAELAKQRLTMAHRYELDSYHAILALVADGAGWTILTPLALMRARRFLPDLDVFPLPFDPPERTIALTARQGALRQLPGQVAGTLKDILSDTVVSPAQAEFPWMSRVLRVL